MLPSRSKILVEAKSKTPCPHEVAKSPLRGTERRSLYWEPAVKTTTLPFHDSSDILMFVYIQLQVFIYIQLQSWIHFTSLRLCKTRFCQILQPLPGVAYSPIE